MSAKHSNGNGCGIPAVFYIRMSSDKQDASPQQQRDELAKLAARDGFHLVGEYTDEAISGDATDKRHGFQRMIRDAVKGKFKAILCWDQDRFGRFDSVEAGFYIHPLRQAGVRLVTVAQGTVDWTTFAGRLIYNVQQEGKHAYLVDLSRNVLRGRSAAARRGEWLSVAPLGYRVANKRLVLGDESMVALARGMFRDYLAGHSLRAVAADLNRRGIATRRGATWDGSDVKKILTNRAYLGEYRWGDRRTGKYHHADDLVVIPDNHPAMIDPTTFDAVQRRLVERRTATTPHQDGGGFVFTGICQCGKCEGPMCGHTDRGTIRLRCRNSAVKDTCDVNSVGQAELLDVVLTAIEKRFADPQKVERFKAILTCKAKQRTASVDVAGLTRELGKVDTQLATARRNMVLADGPDLVRQFGIVVRELMAERDRLNASIQDAQRSPGHTAADLDQRITKVVDMLQRLRATVVAAPIPKQRETLAGIVSKVEVWSSQSGGRGSTFQLERGVVHLRPDMWGAEADNLCSTTRSASQLMRLLTIPFTVKKAA